MHESNNPKQHLDPATHRAPAPRIWALVPCAGSGARAGTTGPKQYRLIAGKPMVTHTLLAFSEVARVVSTLVVLSPEDQRFQALGLQSSACRSATCGGSTRAASVINGLKCLLDEGAAAHDWVLVHDAARCLIQPAQINALIDACLDDEVGGLLAVPLADTLKVGVQGRVAATLNRSDKWLAQTPQMFRIGSLVEALEVAGEFVTDESSAIEALGLQPKLVLGHAQNFKVTYAQDFELADLVLCSRAQND